METIIILLSILYVFGVGYILVSHSTKFFTQVLPLGDTIKSNNSIKEYLMTLQPPMHERTPGRRRFLNHCKDILKSSVTFCLATCIASLFWQWGFAESNIIVLYVLNVLITSIITDNKNYSLIISVISVIAFNYLFTEPRFTLHAYAPGYPVTFLVMFLAAAITGTLARKLKTSALQSAEAAYRIRVLFEAEQEFSQKHDRTTIIDVLAQQMMKLFHRDIVYYVSGPNHLSAPYYYPSKQSEQHADYLNATDQEAVGWVMQDARHLQTAADQFPDANYIYYAIRMEKHIYGVIGIAADAPLEEYEQSILLSILGECALALENDHNVREKEAAALRAEKEKIRGDLLRSISHDLRTPLTSISGNAGILLSDGCQMPEDKRQQLYDDIYHDSQWLIQLVENLLAVTRMEDDALQLHFAPELLKDVIDEVLAHIRPYAKEHTVSVDMEDELILVHGDGKLLLQLFLNLIDNALKYTPSDSTICIHARKQEHFALVEVADNGPGISSDDMPHVFERFFTTGSSIADGRRSIGLGLALCQAIVEAHGGKISVANNETGGATFTFTLPLEEVNILE